VTASILFIWRVGLLTLNSRPVELISVRAAWRRPGIFSRSITPAGKEERKKIVLRSFVRKGRGMCRCQ